MKISAGHQLPSCGDFWPRWDPESSPAQSDDDPSAITTYSIAGASHGYGLLWVPLVALPLVLAVQWMCARLETVTGCGLAAAVRSRYPRWVSFNCVALLAVANTFQIGADLAGMGEVLTLVTDLPRGITAPLLAGFLFAMLTLASYRHIVAIFKWMALLLLAYVAAAFWTRPDWATVAGATFAPGPDWQPDYWSTLLGIIGSIISPYIFFWQAEQMVEDECPAQLRTPDEQQANTIRRLRTARADVTTGITLACAIAYFIILTTATTLYANGLRNIQTAQQAAEALRPFAGAGATLLFSLGLLAAGMLGVPALAASTSFAIAETCGWQGASLAHTPREAPRFYLLLAAGIFGGLALNYLGIPPVRMLYVAAIVNGVLAAPLLVIVCLLTSDRRVMGEYVNSWKLRLLGGTAAVLVTAATRSCCWFGCGRTDNKRRPKLCASSGCHRSNCLRGYIQATTVERCSSGLWSFSGRGAPRFRLSGEFTDVTPVRFAVLLPYAALPAGLRRRHSWRDDPGG